MTISYVGNEDKWQINKNGLDPFVLFLGNMNMKEFSISLLAENAYGQIYNR